MQNNEEMIRVILCKPNERAQVIEIEDSLEAMQETVGGWIEEYMPFEDEVAVVCNEEGKLMGLPLSRAITDEDGQLQDIIAGDFFLAYAPVDSEKFLSMPPELEKKYLERFDLPESFRGDGSGVMVIRFDPGNVGLSRNSADYER